MTQHTNYHGIHLRIEGTHRLPSTRRHLLRTVFCCALAAALWIVALTLASQLAERVA